MHAAPDIARIAGLIGDRARAAMLSHLTAGRAFTATELARAARVTKQTTSFHLRRLVEGGLVAAERRGRHRYFLLTGPDVGTMLESVMGVATRVGALRSDPGPPDSELRRARVCYDHLAGELAVRVFDALLRRKLLRPDDRRLALTESGQQLFHQMGIDLTTLRKARRPLCLACFDWSERRHHLAGGLGAALLAHCLSHGWARRQRDTRVVSFSALGERALRSRFAD
jgi:DNA-binding transcriptional ArsR family regulator